MNLLDRLVALAQEQERRYECDPFDCSVRDELRPEDQGVALFVARLAEVHERHLERHVLDGPVSYPFHEQVAIYAAYEPLGEDMKERIAAAISHRQAPKELAAFRQRRCSDGVACVGSKDAAVRPVDGSRSPPSPTGTSSVAGRDVTPLRRSRSR